MCVLAFVVVGSNEVVMVVTAISVTLYYLFSLFQHKVIYNGRFLLLITTALGSALMVFAPGNNLRAENNLAKRSIDQLSEAFSLSFNDLTIFVGQYLWIPVLPLLALSMLYFARPERTNVKWGHLFITIVLLFVLIFSVIFPGYYIYKMAAPLRTQNFNLWILVLCTIVIGRILSPLIFSLKSFSPTSRINLGSIGFLICIFLFSGSNNTQRAYADLFSGSAKEFEEQYNHRTQSLLSCTNTICKVPAYSVYPFTTFHSDLDSDHENWWNFLYGKFNGNKQVSVDYSDLIPFYHQSISFNPGDSSIENYNIENLTDSVGYNGGYSYHISPAVEYGGGFSFKIRYN